MKSANSITNVFTPAGGAVGGEAVFTTTNSTASGILEWPAAYPDSGFLKILPVRWPGPIMP